MLVHVFSVREAYTKTNVNDLCRDDVLPAFSNVECVLLTTSTHSLWIRRRKVQHYFAKKKLYNICIVLKLHVCKSKTKVHGIMIGLRKHRIAVAPARIRHFKRSSASS